MISFKELKVPVKLSNHSAARSEAEARISVYLQRAVLKGGLLKVKEVELWSAPCINVFLLKNMF